MSDIESSPLLTGRVADVSLSSCCHLVWPTLVEEVDGAERRGESLRVPLLPDLCQPVAGLLLQHVVLPFVRAVGIVVVLYVTKSRTCRQLQ